MWSRHLSQYLHAWRRRGRRERKSKLQEQNVGGGPVRCTTEEVDFYHWAHSNMVFTALVYRSQIAAWLWWRRRNPHCFGTAMCNTLLLQLHEAHALSICGFQAASIHVVVKCSVCHHQCLWRKHKNYRKRLREKWISRGHHLTLQQLAAHDYRLICSLGVNHDN